MNRSASTSSPTSFRDGLKKIELPWFILAALLVSTLVTAYQNSRQLRVDATARFNDIGQSESRAISRQVHDFEDLMYGISALAHALPTLDSTAWGAFFDVRMPAPEDYEGLVAVQYVPVLPMNGKLSQADAPLTRIFRHGDGTSAGDWSKMPAIAEAVAKARSSSRAIASASLDRIAGLDKNVRSPMALVLSVGADRPIGKASASRQGGYLVAIVDLHAMISRIRATGLFPVELELFDGEKLLYNSADSGAVREADMTAESNIEIGTRPFRLRISSTPVLEGRLQNNTPRTILLIGVLGTVLLAGLIWLLTRLREQAETLAASMTRKLQDQTKFTEDLIEFNPSPIFRKDSQGRFVSVNRAWEQLAGRARQDILGKSYAEFQRPEIAEQNEQLDQRLLASETGYEMAEAFITNAEDKQFETIIAKQVLRGSDGRVEGLIGTITDVTPIKRLERELARQREQLDLVIRSSQQGIWDIELVDDGETYYSQRFREILGFADGGFPARFDWEATIHPDDLPAFRRHMVSHFKGETPLFDIESRVRARDGEYLWVRTRAIAQRNPSGRAVRFVGSISDVTDRKQAEMKLVEANVRVTEAARAKEAFLATMSHEIRTPLNGVLGMASLLSETTLNDEQRDYIRLIRASGDTLLRLIDDVLDFSKIESGRMTLESVPVEIVPVAEEAFELVAEKAREKDLALLFDMHDDVPYYILGDATRIRQILLNLLSNAIKFTAKGEIKFSLSSRRVLDGGLELEGRVSDTGIGIPAERAGQLFQPFTQVDASTTRKYGGTGLGLAICKRLTQLMGGDIRVESTEGQGSTFIFTIRTHAARGPLKPYMQRDVFDFLGKRLLVVDRNASRRPILIRRYSRWGFDVTAVTPVEAAEAYMRGPRFDVLLTDMVQPSPEAGALRSVLEKDDQERKAKGEMPVASVLQSTVSRAELSQRGVRPPLRHDIFIMRPAGRARLFDVLMRAVLHEPNQDIATRPYTPEPVYDREFQSMMQAEAATAEPKSPSQGLAHQRQVEASARSQDGQVLNVLVAEDNEVNQRVIQGMLNNMGHQCTVVGDGREAVNVAIAEHFDLVLMDIHMPELDGVGAMQNIREHLIGDKCPPVVAMTAHAMSGDREHYLEAGMDDYIAKPIRSSELVKLLERVKSKMLAAPWADRATQQPITVSATPRATAAEASVGLLPPVLDIEQLQDLCYLPAAPGEEADSADPVGGLILLFKEKAIERMGLIETMLGSGDWHGLAETAHSLRGASASMGFPRVAALCKDLELAARSMENGDSTSASRVTQADLDKLFERIRHHYAEADRALREWLLTAPIAR
jgi:PAS domain S-box-containing protein